ncbi:hypothetical protein [Algoriphagus sp. NG3]|uniref:hypothetical protein n=1 Tax=Algoriphagus sp. NG3 TaxID=3097546 RepID=UPI002A81EEC9|nr:hypothetical protein [Algoriphagus sp. NG3]WPR77867.1 hypothetical protein SLW71_10970 [Algoriphagus sp. NG3]
MRPLRLRDAFCKRNPSFLYRCGLCLVICFSLLPTYAQDTHHWNNQFGNRAALLGGAVLTDTIDNAGVFYNPGNLGFLDTASISINSNFYGLDNINIQNALGREADYRGLQFNTVPLLISGSVSLSPKWKLSYGLLTPVSFKFNGNARLVEIDDWIQGDISPGDEELVAESSLNTRLQETTLVLGMGRKINSHWGLGLSLINTLRTTDFTTGFSAKTLSNGEDYFMVSRTQSTYVNYFSVRSALKAGVNYQNKLYGLGFTITSPGVNLMGNGTVSKDITINNLYIDRLNRRGTAFASDRQEKLKARFKAPLEISAGGHVQLGKGVVHLNITHFGGIDTYQVIKADPGTFIRPGGDEAGLGSDKFLNVETAMKAVTNFGLGYEMPLKANVKLLGSFRTDFSYFDENTYLSQQIVTELTQWDIYHFTAGTIINKSRSSLTLGLVLSYGSTDEYLQKGNFSNATIDEPLEGALTITKAKYTNFGLLIGYSFNFKKLN